MSCFARRVVTGWSAALLTAIAGPASGPASAQAVADPPRFELRLDGFAGGGGMPAALHAGAGVTGRFGIVQLGVLGGLGPSRDGAGAHTEGVARFHVDPFRQRRWGLYGAGGGGVRWADGSEPYLFFSIGLEGRRSAGGWSPAIEAGVARGVRMAVALRRTPAARR